MYHGNVVVNGYVSIGDDCELHGNNCIGNKGKIASDFECPVIKNNVDIGVGTNIIGSVIIEDNIKIAANSLVNKSFLESGWMIGGVPAKKIKKYTEEKK